VIVIWLAGMKVSELSLDFLNASIDDLKASQILYEHQLYALSIFHLQQAIEKALKSILLFLKMFPREEDLESWLSKDVSHYVMENIGKIMLKYVQTSFSSISAPIASPISDFLEKQVKDYEKEVLRKLKHTSLMKKKDLERLLDLIIKRCDEKWVVQKINEGLHGIWTEVLLPPQILSNIRSEIEARFLDSIKQTSLYMLRLGIISLIFEGLKIEKISRYPSSKNSRLGPKIFAGQHPLTTKLNKLIEIVDSSIKKMNEFMVSQRL